MDMKLKEVADLLHVSNKTIYRWIKDGKIPCYRINHQYRFHRYEIEKWASMKDHSGSKINSVKHITDNELSQQSDLLWRVKNGGIYYRINSLDINSALSNTLDLLNLHHSVNRDYLLEMLCKRESMAPTSVGYGIALPHPREPLIPDVHNESISICFLDKPINGYALDSEPVNTLILILSATPETHLKTLARISFLCKDEGFLKLIKSVACRENIFSFIEKFDESIK